VSLTYNHTADSIPVVYCKHNEVHDKTTLLTGYVSTAEGYKDAKNSSISRIAMLCPECSDKFIGTCCTFSPLQMLCRMN